MGFRRIVLFVLAGLFLASAVALLLFSLRNRTEPFSGDGNLHDAGFWSYPRYRVGFPKLDLAVGTNHVLTCRGVPRSKLFFDLSLPGLPGDQAILDNFDVLKAKGARLRVEISSTGRKPIAEANDLLANWVITKSATSWKLYHSNLAEVEFDERTTYSMRIELLDAPPDAAPLTVIPKFWGGGLEH